MSLPNHVRFLHVNRNWDVGNKLEICTVREMQVAQVLWLEVTD